MQDIKLSKTEYGMYDLDLSGSDFFGVSGLDTGIPVSFFTDARASAPLVAEARKRRGWVGNTVNTDGYELGGLLWMLDQTRLTQDTLNLARIYALESLQWMLDDGIAKDIEVSVEKTDTTTIKIYTTITAPSGRVERYASLWRSTEWA